MKPMWIALLLCAAPAAFGQTMPQEPPSPLVQEPGSQQPLLQMPQQLAPQPRTFKLEPRLKAMPQVQVPGLGKRENHPKPAPGIDPEILRRPVPGSFQQQEPRAPMAHSLYPGLELLPVETARLEPIPTLWPGFRMESIPTTWPNARMAAVTKTATSLPAKK